MTNTDDYFQFIAVNGLILLCFIDTVIFVSHYFWFLVPYRGMTEDLRKSGKINGIMVINSKNDTNDFVKDVKNVFSPDRKCPNEFQSMLH